MCINAQFCTHRCRYFFCSKCVKWVNFFYFAKFCINWCSCTNNIVLTRVSFWSTFAIVATHPQKPMKSILRVSLVQLFEKKCFLKKWSFQKVYNEKVFFQKVECLVKAVKKYFLKKLSVWLAFIKVAVWEVNYQKWQCIYKRVYFILKSILWNYFFLTNIS